MVVLQINRFVPKITQLLCLNIINLNKKKLSIAIITGASSGIGAEFAYQLDAMGLTEIWLVARRQDRLEELKLKLKTPSQIIVADLTQQVDLDRISSRIAAEKPSISYLINNAGFGKTGRFYNLSLKENIDMIDLNIRALTFLTHVAIPYMPSGGNIILLSSSVSFMPVGGFSVYAAAKSFVLSFGLALREELKEKGIKVCTVCPGPVKTEFGTISNLEMKSAGGDVLPSDIVKLALKDCRKNNSLSLFGLSIKPIPLISRIFGPKLLVNLGWRFMKSKVC